MPRPRLFPPLYECISKPKHMHRLFVHKVANGTRAPMRLQDNCSTVCNVTMATMFLIAPTPLRQDIKSKSVVIRLAHCQHNHACTCASHTAFSSRIMVWVWLR